MLCACYQDGVQVEISADGKGVKKMMKALLSSDAQLEFDTPPMSISKYWDGSLRHLRVHASSGHVFVKREGDIISFEGDKNKLAILADNLEILPDPTKLQGPHGHRHMHVEYFPEHFVLREASEALIFTFIE